MCKCCCLWSARGAQESCSAGGTTQSGEKQQQQQKWLSLPSSKLLPSSSLIDRNYREASWEESLFCRFLALHDQRGIIRKGIYGAEGQWTSYWPNCLICYSGQRKIYIGFPRPLADPPDGLDVMQLERLAYWATLSRQLKDNQDIYKRFLFHYSRTQKPTQPVKSGIPPVHPLMRLAAQLEDRRVKRFPQQRVGFGDCHSGFHQEVPSCHTIMDSSRMSTAQHPMANCQGTEETRTITPSRTVQEFSGKEKLDQIKKPSNYFEHMSTFFL
ncbi:neuromedin-S isoform X7 [Mirounga leonina]|uniref:neuromedin-S isoform X7 n=1 Tax=Mirounga leonina TaxID=9715 RepID=UPI00156C3C2A|nr:neuromedin-S isoform X7 [Mirounga leonina]